jgi:hypothetical protein
MRYLILLSMVLTAGCRSFEQLAIDPCSIMPEMNICYAVPLNQPGKQEYERPLNVGDICVTQDEYAKIQKHYRELMKRCGDRCQ